MRNTAIFLAEQWQKTEDILYTAFAMPPEQAVDYIVNNYPQVQGMRNQAQLRRLAALSCVTGEIPKEIAAALAEQGGT